MIKNAIFLPIKPQYANLIASGAKTFEYRKVVPRQKVEEFIVYSSSPEKKILGVVKIKAIHEDSPKNLWKKTHRQGGIKKADYDAYFKGRKKAFAIEIQSFSPAKRETPAKEIQTKHFSIPQSFRYVDIGFFKRVQKILSTD